jgi:hypothetical protein
LRDILTILAILLVLILTAALAVPYLVDWTAERGLIEAQLSDLVGQQVKIRGDIDLKLLPTPYLQLADVEVADPAAGSDIRADELHLEIALPPLMRGEVDFVEALLVRPQLRLRIKDDAVPLPMPAHGLSEQMRFERISIEDGTVAIDDPATGRSYKFSNIALAAEASALSGPFTGDGTFETTGEPTAFRFSTGERAGDRLHFKLIVDENANHPGADLDAKLIFAPRELPSIDGTLNLTGHQRGVIPLPWRVSGALHADLRKASISNMELRLGDEDHATSLDGAAQFDFGAKPRGKLLLETQQLDLDRLLSAKDEPPPLQRLRNALGGLAKSQNLGTLGMSLSLRYSADSVLIGGDTLGDVAGSVAVSGTQATSLSFKADGPGLSHLAADGTIETGVAPAFVGHIEASADDVRRLREWLAVNLPQSMPANLAMPISSFALAGSANISQVGFVGSDLALRVNGSMLSGTLAYTQAVGPEPARLFADLSAPALELDSLPDFSGLARQTAAMDLALRLDAHAVKLSETQAGEINAGHIVLKFDRSGSDAKLEDLAVSDISGADLTASGQWNGHAGNINVKLDAERLDGLVGLLRRFVQGPSLSFLADRAAVLSPAHLTLDAEAKMNGDTFGLNGLNLTGTAGQTTISGNAAPDPQDAAAFNLTLHFDAKDSTTLLEQIGVAALPLPDIGPGSIEVTAHGGQRLGIDVAALLAGANFAFRGSIDPSLSAPRATGTARLTSADLSNLMRVTGFAFPDLTTQLPANISAKVDATSNSVALNNLAGTLGGSKIAGHIAYSAEKGIDGALSADAMSLSSLLALALGSPQPAKPGVLWSDAHFAAPEINPPPTHVAVDIANFDLWPQIAGHDAHFDLAIAGGSAGLELGMHRLAMQIGAGSAQADLTLRRDGTSAAAEGHLHLRDCALALPSARGLLSADLDFAGTGDSATALVAGFAGSGTIGFNNLVLPQSDPGALARIFEAVEEDNLSVDEAEIDRVLLAEFDKAPLSVGNASFDAGLAAGVLRLAQKNGGARREPGITQDLEVALDLRNLTIDHESTLGLVALPRNWSGAPPQVTLNWGGNISNPVQTLDSSTFVNALAARAIARESSRIEAQEFDVHEHAFFVSRLESEREREAERQKAEEDLRRAAELEQLGKAAAARTEQKAEGVKRKTEETIRNATVVPIQIGQPPPRAPTMPAPGAGTTSFPDPTAAGRY